MPPQLGIGSCTPRPRKLSVASAMMMKPTPTEARTISGATMLGRMWRHRISTAGVPQTIAASTKSSCFCTSTSDRVSRAMPGHHTIDRAMMTVASAGSEHGRNQDGEHQLGKREHDVDATHEQCVDPAAEIAGDHAER